MIYNRNSSEDFVQLNCEVRGLDSNEEVVWEASGVVISENGDVSMSLQNTFRIDGMYNLQIVNPDLQMADNYTCKTKICPYFVKSASLVVLGKSESDWSQ